IRAPLAEGSLDDATKVPHVQMVIDARLLRVLDPGRSAKDRQDVQARMLGADVLDVSRFPRITFHSLGMQRVNPRRWVVRGELELHGEIHEMSVNVLTDGNHYKGSATVRQSDFGIVPSRILAGAVKVMDEVDIDFDIVISERSAAASHK